MGARSAAEDPPDLEFDSPRLRARALREDDLALFVRLFCDAETMQYIGTPAAPAQAERDFRAALGSRAGVLLTLAERATDRPVGLCSVQRIDPARRLAEAGIMLLPEFRALGYAKEGLAALVTRAFQRLAIDEVRVRISAAHSIVRRLVVGIGFIRRGDLEAAADGSGLQVWSAHRASWRTTTTIEQRGEADVGRHRVS